MTTAPVAFGRYVTIAKQFHFDAAHHIDTFPNEHKCRRMHGHSYVAEISFMGTVDEKGLCAGIDYADIVEMWRPIHNLIDHRVLNDVRGLEIPTTEVLVWWIGNTLGELWKNSLYNTHFNALLKVRVKESDSTWCEAHAPFPGQVL